VDERDGIITASETLDPSMTLVGLSTRPGGAHRKLYIWTSLAVSAGAIVIGILAWALRVQASGLSSLARQVDASWQDKLKGVTFARPPMPGMELLDLRTEIERVRRESAPLSGIERPRPIVRELEVLSNVLALPDFELTSISLDSSKSQVTIQVSAPDLSNAEALNDALGRIAGSEIESWTFTPQSRIAGSDRVPCTYIGTFRPQPAPVAPAPPASFWRRHLMSTVASSMSTDRIDDRRERFAAAASMEARRNRPTHLVVLSLVLLLTAVLMLLWALSSRNSSRDDLETARFQAQTVETLVGEWKTYKSTNSDPNASRINEPLTSFYSRIEGAATRAGMKDRPPSPRARSRMLAIHGAGRCRRRSSTSA
jgi:nitrogen fixation-related uncharacterized protein